MFPRHYRVTVPEFYRIASRPIRIPFSHGLISVKRTQVSHIRWCIIIPKRVDKRSTVRHKLRRHLVELIRPLLLKYDSFRCAVLIRVDKIFSKEESISMMNEFASILDKQKS